MSNSIYQAIFIDKSEFLMSSQSKAILFIGRDRKRYTYNMRSENLYKNRSIMIRLEYFKAVLRGWISSDDTPDNFTISSTSNYNQSDNNLTGAGNPGAHRRILSKGTE